MKREQDTKNTRKKKTEREKYFGIYFLGFVIFLYLFLFQFEPQQIQDSLMASGHLITRILPVLLVVIFFMGITNYFIKPKTVSRYVGKGSGIKGWCLAIFTGILSHGPIYVWYPLLRDFRNQGMRNGLIAAFLYNRAIKIPLLPLMVYYFGIRFVVVLLIYMIMASVVEGKIIEIRSKKRPENKGEYKFP